MGWSIDHGEPERDAVVPLGRAKSDRGRELPSKRLGGDPVLTVPGYKDATGCAIRRNTQVIKIGTC